MINYEFGEITNYELGIGIKEDRSRRYNVFLIRNS